MEHKKNGLTPPVFLNEKKSLKEKKSNLIMSNLLKKEKKNGSFLDKLAKCVHNENVESFRLVASIDTQDKKTLLKKARKKHFSVELVKKLIEENPKSFLLKSYKNTLKCSNEISQCLDGKLRAHYCKNRFCMTCNGIRTAKEINTYEPIIKKWEDAQLVTLTVPNCTAKNLKFTTKLMSKNFAKILRSGKRTIGTMEGVRKFECTYNKQRNDYHPHYHILVKDYQMAFYIVNKWLKLDNRISSKAQDLRPANLASLKELFKYMTKVMTKTSKGTFIDAKSLNNIFTAIQGSHTVSPFGFKVCELNEEEVAEPMEENKEILAIWTWNTNYTDWIDLATGEALTGYTPCKKFKNLLKSSSP